MSDNLEEQGGKADIADIIWDDQYDNPDAKVILISNDNVGFRVDAWYFKKKSEFIKHLADLPSQESLETAPIHLDCSSTTIRPFVHHIYANTAIDFTITTSVCKEFFELCDRFQAPQIYDVFCRSIQLRMESGKNMGDLDVWEVFRLAAMKDDFLLAKSAIAALDSVGLTHRILFTNSAGSLARFEGLPIRHVHAVLMARYTACIKFETPSGDSDIAEVWMQRDSKSIASSFVLM